MTAADLALAEQASVDCLDLSTEDASYLRGRADAIRVTPRFGGAGYTVNMGPYVGVLRLPSGRILRVRPKVPVRNVFYMLARARYVPWHDEITTYNTFDEVLEFLAEYFAGLVEDLIRRGLYRHYLEVEDNLPVVRGRVLFAEDLRRNLIERQRTYCRYNEFSWDIPENQILRQVVHQLAGWGFRLPVTSRLSVIDAQLGELSSVRFAAAAVDGFTYHRLNEHYRSPHLLARLFLEGAGITDESGQYDFRTFLVNMNALFEEFVRTVLSEELQFEYEVVGHPPLRLDRAGKLLARPDIALLCGGDIRFIADCKYEVTAGELSAGHLYQVLSYCTISGITIGMLIYPLHAVELADLVDIERSPIGIHRHVIDLNLEPGQLADSCRSLAESVRSWVSGTSPLGVLVG